MRSPLFEAYALGSLMPDEALDAVAELVDSFRRPFWHDFADCKLPEAAGVNFFPTPGEDMSEAKAICAGCPARWPCREDAIARGDRNGIWGGTSPEDRRRILAERASDAA